MNKLSESYSFVPFEEYRIKTGTKIICDKAFANCNGLKKVIIPDSCLVIGEGAFEDCSSLKEIILPNSILSIKVGAFRNCPIKTIILPNSLLRIENYAFENCRNLEKIILPPDLKEIDGNPFDGCQCSIISKSSTFMYDQEKRILYDANNKKLISMLFYRDEIVIPDYINIIGENACHIDDISKVSIPSAVNYISRNAFGWFTKIEQLVFWGNYTTFHEDAFSGIIRTVIIPKGCRSHYTNALSNTYINCIIEEGSYIKISNIFFSLKKDILLSFPSEVVEYVIPNSVETIADNAFSDCDVETITIPESVTKIGHRAFANCYSLKTIFWYSKKCNLFRDIFDGCLNFDIIKKDGTKISKEVFINNLKSV